MAVLEELPGRVFVASLAETGSAARARGKVLPGDLIVAVEGVSCQGLLHLAHIQVNLNLPVCVRSVQ